MRSHGVSRLVMSLGAVVCACGALAGCEKPKPEKLPAKTETLAELRVVRHGVHVAEEGRTERDPYPRERLTENEVVRIDDGGLAWIRRDAGSTVLVKGPAKVIAHRDTIDVVEGRVFAESPQGIVTSVTTPGGPLELSDVRASLEVHDGVADVYVLSGEVRAASGEVAAAGELLHSEKGKTTVTAKASWDDWTGGLATTDRAALPAPFGVGTVGARNPGATGAPRSPLTIQRLDVRVKIDGDFATTEVDETFFNPVSDTVEGIYRFHAPDGANLERFGVDRQQGIAWGYVKEKQQAAAQYGSHVYRGSTEDPALLEWKAPGEYEAKLYPIGPGATRRVVVRYTEWLGRAGAKSERRLYVYPMAAEGSEESLPHVEEFNASIDLTNANAGEIRSGMDATRRGKIVNVREHDFVPRADLAVELFDPTEENAPKGPNGEKPKLRDPSITPIYRAAHVPDLAMIAPTDTADAKTRAAGEADYILVPVSVADLPRQTGGLDIEIVVDSSAATDDASLALARATTRSLLAHLGKDDRVALYTGDDELHSASSVSGFRAADAATKADLIGALAHVRRGGATDLGRVLTTAIEGLDPKRASAIVYIGDGRPTVGELSLSDLEAKLHKAPRPARLFALGVGESANMALLGGIADGGFAAPVADEHSAAMASLHVLEVAERAAELGVTVDLGPNVERVFPRDAAAITEGETLLVVGRVTGKDLPTELVAKGSSGSHTFKLTRASTDDEGDLRRRWAGARLTELMADGAGQAALVDLGVRQGIITPFTSIYVPTFSEMTPQQRQEVASNLRRRFHSSRGDDAEEAVEKTDDDRSDERHKDEATAGAKPKAMPQSAAGEEGEMGRPRATAAATSAPNVDEADDKAAFGRDSSTPPNGTGRAAPPPGTLDMPADPGVGGVGVPLASAAPMASARLVDQVSPEPVVAEPPSPRPTATVGIEEPSKLNRYGGDDLRGIAKKTPGGLGGGQDNANKDGAKNGPSGHESVRSDPTPTTVTTTSKVVYQGPAHVVIDIDNPDRLAHPCSDASKLPFSDRLFLWRERLQATAGQVNAVKNVYEAALVDCELPSPRERSALLSAMLDFIPSTAQRVALYRAMVDDMGAADALYRGILARVTTPQQMKELSQALGLVTVEPSVLDKALKDAKTPADKVVALRGLTAQFPNDMNLALILLDAIEDASDAPGARSFADTLRARPDADTRVRTAVGELYLRLAAKDGDADEKASDEREARRAFGEIVEFAPEDPVARRRLGDLFRAHGFYEDAARQYETLGKLTPDDTAVPLLLAACANGMGKLEEAIRWTEKGGSAGAPDASQGPYATARAFAVTYLEWGKLDAEQSKDTATVDALTSRLTKVLSTSGSKATKGQARVVLTWSHPEFHPLLWSNATGTMMPAPEGDPTLGIAQAIIPARAGGALEIRIEPQDLERAARLGATATLTVIFDENGKSEVVSRTPITFSASGKPTKRFTIDGTAVREEASK